MNSLYKYHVAIISFQMIENCKANEGLKDANKMLAILISYDGMVHIINRSFHLERMFRLTQTNILDAIFFSNPRESFGVSALMIDTYGDVYNADGKLLEKTENKNPICITGELGQLYIGGFSKKLTVISRKEAVKIE